MAIGTNTQVIKLYNEGFNNWGTDIMARQLIVKCSRDLGYSDLRVVNEAGETIAWYPFC